MPVLTPNYLTVDPVTGLIGANFVGHVHAQTLDLDAQVSGGTQAPSEVRWLDAAGTVLEYLLGTDNASGLGDSLLQVRSQRVSGGVAPSAVINLSANPTHATHKGQIVIDVSDGLGEDSFLDLVANDGSLSHFDVSVAGVLRRVIDALGKSHFLQLANSISARLCWGRVSTTGATVLDGSQDWSAVNNSAGVYTVTFNPTFPGQSPIGIALQIGSGFVGATDLSASSASTLQFKFFSSAGVLQNADFAFIAVGRP